MLIDTAPKFSMAGRPAKKNTVASTLPGPDTYSVANTQAYLYGCQGKSFSAAVPQAKVTSADNPGPGAYTPGNLYKPTGGVK